MKLLDEMDRKIIRELQRDARLSNTDLAARVGLSPSRCWQRVKRLEERGYIECYTAVINQKRMGLPDTVMVEVILDRHDDGFFEKFSQTISALPEVLEAYMTTGEYDFIIKVAVAGADGYEQFLRHKLYKIPGIRQTRSSFTLRCIKSNWSPPT
ncbi:Lrp/AsnC family transcriptional regulator [Bradyrhizobium icense]|uniref:AsnC family transcriptional regulator n=1 Tax=Bradyrhizobium icense TaxID=1274631 RepID=A0A1B1UBL2_9BRAD|nr:Lrp/AsnC family transcriptional regulator [Bradyrhizobium icense]ANW00155.1 AsnC family transcriptional regulator [Bradyrhizobium icense]